MEQLIFLAVIVVFSIIDSIARTKKKRQQQSGGSGQDTPRVPEEWQWEDDVPSYDADPSYDDAYASEGATRKPETLPRAERSSPKSSEGMVPADIWEEIAGLARGRVPTPKPTPRAPKAPEPVQSRPIEPEPKPVRARATRVRPPLTGAGVHRAHADYGTDPSSRRRSEQDGLDPLRGTLSQDVRAVRRMLKTHTRSALRQAVILQEVLGPPAAAAPERFPESA
jgi:hypothetical protein